MSTQTVTNSHENKASKGELLGFAFNNPATNAWHVLISLYFLVYCTEIYGFSPIVVGFIMTGTRLLDAFTDPLIGIQIDKTDTKFGRFRPWILAGSILGNIAFLTMFSGIKLGSDTANLIFIIAVYCIYIIAYTFQTACTKSAQNVMTDLPKQRTTINGIGTIIFMPLMILVMALSVPIINAFGGMDTTSGWIGLASIIAAIQFIFTIFVIIGLRKKDVPENYLGVASTQEKPQLKDYVEIFKHNRALQMLVVAASTNKMAQTVQSGLTVMFYVYVAGNIALQSVVPVATMPITLIAIPLTIMFTNKVGRRKAFTLGSWASMIWGVLAIVLLPLSPSSATWLIVIMGINTVVMQPAGDVNIISMIGDATDYEAWKNGKFIPGMIGTSFSFIDKVVSSFSSSISGIMLGLLGFVSITETAPTSELFWGILIMYFGFPALGHLCSIIAMKFYPLDNETQEQMMNDLAERRAARATAENADVAL